MLYIKITPFVGAVNSSQYSSLTHEKAETLFKTEVKV